MSSEFVYPRFNLPDEAVPFARAMKDRVEGTISDLDQANQKIDNGLRATGGQLAVLSNQLTELRLGRSSHTALLEDFTLTSTTPGVYPTFTRTFKIPAAYLGRRSASVSVSAQFTRTSATGNMTIWVELERNGEIIWRRTGAVIAGDTLSAPPEWGNPGFSDVFFTTLPDAEGTYALRFYTHTFVAETVTVYAHDMSVTVTYGDLT